MNQEEKKEQHQCPICHENMVDIGSNDDREILWLCENCSHSEVTSVPKPQSKEIHCYNCGKVIPVGKPAVAITAGTITEDGFYMDDDPWMTIACEICGEQINEVIGDLNTAFASLG